MFFKKWVNKEKRTFEIQEMDHSIPEKSEREFQVEEQQYTMESDSRAQCKEYLQKHRQRN